MQELDSTGASIIRDTQIYALLYSVMVTFPILRSKYAREYTLQALDATLNRINSFSWLRTRQYFLWYLTVAGIAAFGYHART